MNSSEPASLPTLPYAAPLREERTEDGTLRLTLVTNGSHALKMMAGWGVVGILAGVLLVGCWFFAGSVKALAFGLMLGPLSAILWAGLAIMQMQSPRTQTHVIEVGLAGVVIQNPVGARFGVRRHELSELVAVKSSGVALEIYTIRRGTFSCLAFAGAKQLALVADLVNRELAARRPGLLEEGEV